MTGVTRGAREAALVLPGGEKLSRAPGSRRLKDRERR